jgi:hypothetical protein
MIKDETSQILDEIARLHARLPQDDRIPNAYGFTLQKYLDNFSSYAETTADLSDDELDNGIYVDSIQADTQSNLDVILENPSKPESSTLSSASKPTQDDPSLVHQRNIDPYEGGVAPIKPSLIKAMQESNLASPLMDADSVISSSISVESDGKKSSGKFSGSERLSSISTLANSEASSREIL